MSYSLNSLKGGHIGDYIGLYRDYIGFRVKVLKGGVI